MREIAGGEPANIGRIRKRDPKHQVRSVFKGLKTRHTKVLHGPKASHEFEPLDDGDPMLKVFERPNGLDTAFDFWAYHTLFLKITGTSRWWVMRDPDTQMPREMWVIPTHWTRRQPGYEGQPQNYYVQSPWGEAWTVPQNEVVEFFEHSPLNRWEGYSVPLACNEWFDAYDAGVRARLAQYKNGAIPNFHVALGESYGDPDDAMLRRIYSKWFERFQGENRTNLPLITGPDIEVKALGITPVEMQYVENENQYRDMILAAYGVNKALVGIEPSSDTSAYAPQRAFVRSHVNPDLKMTGERITEFIIKVTPGYEDAIAYWDDRAYDDPERKLGELVQQWDRGVITTNEFRSSMGHEPFAHGGDDPMLQGQPLNWATGQKQQGPALEDGDLEAAHKRMVEEPVEKDEGEEPDNRDTEFRTDPVSKDGEWFVEIWGYPSGRQVWRTPPYEDKVEAENHAERWINRRRHKLKVEESMGEGSGTDGGYNVPVVAATTPAPPSPRKSLGKSQSHELGDVIRKAFGDLREELVEAVKDIKVVHVTPPAKEKPKIKAIVKDGDRYVVERE